MKLEHVIIPLAVFSLLAAMPARPISFSGCEGCQATPSSTATTTLGSKWVKITVTPTNGLCAEGSSGCTPYPCEVTVTREWHVGPKARLDFCEEQLPNPPGKKKCEDPAPTSGDTGAGTDIQTNLFVACGGTTSYSITYTTTFGAMTASASAACLECRLDG